jgi:hypothetical protein
MRSICLQRALEQVEEINAKNEEQGLCQRGKEIVPRDEVRDFEELSVRTRQRFDLGWTTGAA